MPFVSVIMGTHNGEKTLKRAVDSILSQTFQDFELIVCDDASEDETPAVLADYAAADPRVRVLRHETKQGLSSALNDSIAAASGTYLARMDDDDISHPDRLEKEVAFLNAHPEYAVVGCRRRTFDDQGVWNECGTAGELKKTDIISGNIFTHPTVMMRKDAIDAVGGYTVSERTMRGQDFDLWCKLYAAGYCGYVLEDVLFDYYEDRDRIKESKPRYRWNNYKTHKIWRKKMGLPVKYDIYAYKELLAIIIPKKLLVYRKKRQQRSLKGDENNG